MGAGQSEVEQSVAWYKAQRRMRGEQQSKQARREELIDDGILGIEVFCGWSAAVATMGPLMFGTCCILCVASTDHEIHFNCKLYNFLHDFLTNKYGHGIKRADSPDLTLGLAYHFPNSTSIHQA